MSFDRPTKTFLLALVITGMVIGAFVVGIGATWLLMRGSTATADEAAEFDVFWEAWYLLENHW